MPGNFPSQQAGAAAKNKPPVAIIIGAVAAVVVIALAAVFFLTNRVSRSDYEEALVQTQALESSYTAINEEFSSASSATDNDSSSAYDEGKKKLKTFKQDSDKPAAMKAVKKDKDVKEKYETFEQDRAKYERYMNDLAQTMPALMKMTHTCTKLPKFDSADMSSYYRDLSKALESCAADAGDLAKVPIKSYAEYGADMQESVSKKKDIVDQMADLNLNDIEYGSADYEKLQDFHAKMSDIDSPTLDQSDLQKAAKEADLSGSLKDLETTLSERSSNVKRRLRNPPPRLIHNLAIPRHIDMAKGGTDRYWSVPPFAMSDDSSVDYREGNLTGCRPDRSGRRCRPGSHPG